MDSFLGIPLRSQHQGDDEFVESVRRCVRKRKYNRIFCAIIAISSVIMLYLNFTLFLNIITKYFPEMRIFQWVGFISGFIFIGIFFSVFANYALTIANWFDGFPFRRKEDLLIKYHDEMNKIFPIRDSRNVKDYQDKGLRIFHNPDLESDGINDSLLMSSGKPILLCLLRVWKSMDSFLAIPLRNQHRSDEHFVGLIRNRVRKRKHIRPLWAIIPILSGFILILCFMRLLNPELEYIPEIWRFQWRGFINGFIYGDMCFPIVFQFVICTLYCSDSLRIHRIEELIIKYHDELKKNIAEPDSDTNRQSHDLHP